MVPAGLRRHSAHMGDPFYMSEFAKLYPFAMVDFEKPETHMRNDPVQRATDGEHKVTHAPDRHYFAEPEECFDCTELEQRILILEAELNNLIGQRGQTNYIPGIGRSAGSPSFNDIVYDGGRLGTGFGN